MGGYDSFLHQQLFPQPCSLTVEEFQLPDPCDPPHRRRPRPRRVVTDEPRRWVDVLFEPGDVIEFRLVPPKSIAAAVRPRKFRMRETAVRHGLYRWAFADEIEVVVDKLAALNRGSATWWGRWDRLRDGWADVSGEPGIPLNIYASINPRLATGGKADDDVLLARSVFVDLERMTVEEAMARVAAAGLPAPTMIVVSGHGVHLYWRLREPITDLALWTALQKRLIRLLGSDEAIHDPSRVMRLPGFMNVNGESPTRCYIHEADSGRRYAVEDILPPLPPEPPQPTKPNIPRRKSANIGCSSSLSVRGDCGDALLRASAYAERFEPVEENRNSTAFRRTCALVEKFDLDAEQIFPLVEKVNEKADDPLDAAEVEEVVEKAVKHVRKKGRRRGTALEGPSRLEQYHEPTGPVVELEAWRREMTQSRLESLGQTGKVFFDGSPTGAGKSTADLTAMEKAGASATFLPTHDACDELVKRLSESGLSAAAHPPLDATTCEKFGTRADPGPAQAAVKAGLNVGEAVCARCELATTCEYQRRREQARAAAHAVATHTRASLSDFTPAGGKPVVFVHEDAVGLLRPLVKVVRYSPKADDPQGRHLHEIVRIAEVAGDIARSWQDAGAIAFATRLRDATLDLIAALDAHELVKPLEDAASAGRTTAALPSVKALPLKPNIARPAGIDYLLRRAMDRLQIRSNGPVLRLTVGYCQGELAHLCAVVDEAKTTGGRSVFTRAVVGVWKVGLPGDAVVWLENASATADQLRELVGREVIDKTPHGRLAYRVPPLQYAEVDITKQTCGNKVRGVVRGLLAQYPQAGRVGVITQQCHVAEIEALDLLWRRRIARVEYFFSGKDRASNSWLDCDLILVVGTPRVPPVAVRDTLIRMGRVDAASRDGQFGPLTWEGKTNDGRLVRIDGRGYADPSWAEVHNLLVKETLRQAVGRGRGVTESGVPVLVVSNESLGLTLADRPLPLVTDAEDETLRLAVSATARNAICLCIGDRAVAPVLTRDVADLSRYEVRTVRDHLASLSSSGLLKKKGERSGWVVADWLLSGMPNPGHGLMKTAS